MTMKHTTRLAWATALFTLAFAGTSLAVHRANSAARDEIAVHLAELRAEREALSFEREALWGETVPGEAWPHYAEALEAMAPFQGNPLRTRIAVALDPGVDAEERAAVLAAVPKEAFTALRRGAHARDGEVVLDWERGFEAPLVKLVDSRALQHATGLRVLLADTPEAQIDAVRSLLDALQFGRDLVESQSLISEMIGCCLLSGESLGAEFDVGLADRLSAPAKRELLAGLRALEASVTVESRAFAGELELLAHAVANGWAMESPANASGLERIRDYVDGEVVFDVHVADHIRRMRELTPELAAAHRLPPLEIMDRVAEIRAEVEASGNPLSRQVTVPFPSVVHSRLRARARLSFLRCALEVHLGEEGAPPLDAFGLGVTVGVEDGRVRVSTPLPQPYTGSHHRVLEVVL